MNATESGPATPEKREGWCPCGNDAPGLSWPCTHGVCGWTTEPREPTDEKAAARTRNNILWVYGFGGDDDHGG
jgi:hypothetical protein